MIESNEAARATASGSDAAKTQAAGQAAVREKIEKLFSDDAPPGSEAPPETGPKTAEQPAPKDGAGETVDLSHNGEETPEQKAEMETRAKERGVTPEQQRADEAAEKTRLEAVAEKTGETFEAIYEREEREGKPTDLNAAAAKAEKKFTQEDVERAVKQRLKNLERDKADLQRQLAEKPVPAATGGLEAELKSVESGLTEAGDMLFDLQDDPEGVRAKFKNWIGDKANDLTVPAMRKMLRDTERGLKARQGELTEAHGRVQRDRATTKQLLQEPELVKAIPFLADEGSEEHAQWRRFVENAPNLGSMGSVELLAAAAMIGLKQLRPSIEAVSARRNGKSAPEAARNGVKLRLPTRMPGTARPGAAGAPRKAATLDDHLL